MQNTKVQLIHNPHTGWFRLPGVGNISKVDSLPGAAFWVTSFDDGGVHRVPTRLEAENLLRQRADR